VGSGVLHDGLHLLLKAAARDLHGNLLAQGVRIPFLWQMQRRVERMQALLAWGAVAKALHLDRAEQAL
jgi:hypothetical protein